MRRVRRQTRARVARSSRLPDRTAPYLVGTSGRLKASIIYHLRLAAAAGTENGKKEREIIANMVRENEGENIVIVPVLYFTRAGYANIFRFSILFRHSS